jgi:hypothetical protein
MGTGRRTATEVTQVSFRYGGTVPPISNRDNIENARRFGPFVRFAG